MRAKFSAALMRWIYPCTADRDIRYYLNGFLVEPHPVKGVLLIATNGHVMSIAYDEDGECDGAILIRRPPGEAITKCSKAIEFSRNEKGKTVTVENDRLTILNPAGEELYLMPGKATMDGNFPDWRRVVPNRDGSGLEGAGSSAVNAALLTGLTKEVDHWRHYGLPVRLWRRSDGAGAPEDRAVIVEVCDRPVMGIVMPMRTSGFGAEMGEPRAVGWFIGENKS